MYNIMSKSHVKYKWDGGEYGLHVGLNRYHIFTFCRVPSCPIHIPFIIYILCCHYFSVSNYLLGCQKGTKGQQKTLKQIISRVQVRFNGVAKIDPDELNYSIDFFSFARGIFFTSMYLHNISHTIF